MAWTRKVLGFVIGTIVGHFIWPISERLGEAATAEWVNHQIAERYGIVSPSQQHVIDFAVSWMLPALAVILGYMLFRAGIWWERKRRIGSPAVARALDIPVEQSVTSSEHSKRTAKGDYTYILSLSDVDVIRDNQNPNVDLSIGLKIKNHAGEPTKFLVETASVTFNGEDGKTNPPFRDFIVIRKDATALYSVRSISEINKSVSALIKVVVEFSILYGPTDADFKRRWSYGLRFSVDPTVLGRGRYSTEYERDEALYSQ
jgi:hypothetical protein